MLSFSLTRCEVGRKGKKKTVEWIHAAAWCTLQTTQGTSAAQSEGFSSVCQVSHKCCIVTHNKERSNPVHLGGLGLSFPFKSKICYQATMHELICCFDLGSFSCFTLFFTQDNTPGKSV